MEFGAVLAAWHTSGDKRDGEAGRLRQKQCKLKMHKVFWKYKLYKPNTYSPQKGGNRHTNKIDTQTSKCLVKITLVKQ